MQVHAGASHCSFIMVSDSRWQFRTRAALHAKQPTYILVHLNDESIPWSYTFGASEQFLYPGGT